MNLLMVVIKFFEELQKKELDLSHWEHLHNFNLERYQEDEVDVDLSPEQEQLVEWVEV